MAEKMSTITNKISTTTTTKSCEVIVVRPQSLNVSPNGQNAETKLFIGEALNAWRAKARCNVVPTERLQELFHELQFNPSEKQIGEMLQTAKVFARKGSKQLNGLTFGEFCVLAADLKRFRTCNFSSSNENKILSSLPIPTAPSSLSSSSSSSSALLTKNDPNSIDSACLKAITENKLECGHNKAHSKQQQHSHENHFPNSNDRTNNDNNISSITSPTTNLSVGSNTSVNNSPIKDVNAPEVFLGGSCNPTTWRADVAIPTLEKLGISFYNPQVSDWTPDLIELEHRAKEKARVLFFVMDSETRASAGAIEAAHIAGQNSRQLVLVLHPYKPQQCILNEPLSPQEYLDLSRNQQLLRELVTRRGLPVLDNIPSGLQRTKAILAGIRDPPSNIASILIVVRGAFDRIVNSLDDEITLQQCQRALSLLGYANSLLSLDNLKNIIHSQKETFLYLNSTTSSLSLLTASTSSSNCTNSKFTKKEIRINFDEFCVLAAYLSVLQQEIHESGCISPIKGTNLPPPPIFLANMQEGIHNRNGDENITMITATSYSKQIFRTSSCTSVPDDRHMDLYRNRDSGTSSPQPPETIKSKYVHIGKRSKISLNVEFMTNGNDHNNSNIVSNDVDIDHPDHDEDESDSNDSVFSSGSSSINSNFCDSFSGLEFRDVYLGGSCYLRTKWRQDYAIPYLISKGITYHLPSLHESILPSQLKGNCYHNDSEKKLSVHSTTCSGIINNKKNTMKIRRKSIKNTQQKKHNELDGDQNEDDDDDYDNHTDIHNSSSSLDIRPNLFNPSLLDSSRVLLFVITNETRSLAPMTLAAHCIGLMYNVVLCVQTLPDFCIIGNDRLTPAAIKDYNRGRTYLTDLAKRQGVPVFNDLKTALECTVEKVKACNSRNSV